MYLYNPVLIHNLTVILISVKYLNAFLHYLKTLKNKFSEMVFMEIMKTSIKHLKPGKFCILDGEPCRVQSITTSVSGKHGAAKARLDAVGIFDGKKRSIIKPADSEIDVPIVEKRSGQIISIMGETAQVMDMETFETFESPIPEDLKEKIKQGGEVLYWILMDRKMIVQVKSE